MIRRFVIVFLVATLGMYAVLAFAGFLLPLADGEALSEQQAGEALDFAFNAEFPDGTAWLEVSGDARHGWLTRRAFVRGSSESDETIYSEQVLKVGWPFTTVRGFVRTMAGNIRWEGVLWVQGDPTAGPVRLLPVEPVWPGLLINSLGVTLLVLAVAALWRQRSG